MNESEDFGYETEATCCSVMDFVIFSKKELINKTSKLTEKRTLTKGMSSKHWRFTGPKVDIRDLKKKLYLVTLLPVRDCSTKTRTGYKIRNEFFIGWRSFVTAHALDILIQSANKPVIAGRLKIVIKRCK